jgi:hypothetical protein
VFAQKVLRSYGREYSLFGFNCDSDVFWTSGNDSFDAPDTGGARLFFLNLEATEHAGLCYMGSAADFFGVLAQRLTMSDKILEQILRLQL